MKNKQKGMEVFCSVATSVFVSCWAFLFGLAGWVFGEPTIFFKNLLDYHLNLSHPLVLDVQLCRENV